MITSFFPYRYVDFTSLYPWCNKMTPAVVGHSHIITENFDDISTYFRLIKRTVLSPRGLFHPVLPYRTQGKLMFSLCKTCADVCNQFPCSHNSERAIQGTWCSVELEKALEKGYQILQLHEVWHFPKTSNELFVDYIKHVPQNQAESKWLSQRRSNRRTETIVHQGVLRARRDSARPRQVEYNPGFKGSG